MGHYYAVTDNELIIVKGLENNNLFLIFIPKLGQGSCLYIEESIMCVCFFSHWVKCKQGKNTALKMYWTFLLK